MIGVLKYMKFMLPLNSRSAGQEILWPSTDKQPPTPYSILLLSKLEPHPLPTSMQKLNLYHIPLADLFYYAEVIGSYFDDFIREIWNVGGWHSTANIMPGKLFTKSVHRKLAIACVLSGNTVIFKQI